MSRKSRRTSRTIRAAKAAAGPALPTIRLTAGAAGVARIAAAEGAEKPRRFSGTAYTGAPMRPEGWYHPIIVDLDGVDVPKQHRPALRQHDHNRVLGHTDSVDVSQKAGVEVAGVFSGHPSHTDEVLHAADRGFEWELSIGADPIATEELKAGQSATVNGREVTGPMTISRRTKLGEVSFVPLGADGDTSVSVHASRGGRLMRFRAMLKAAKAAGNVLAAKYSDEQIDKMDDKEAKAALKKCMAAEEEEDTEAADDDDPGEKKAEGKGAKAADDEAADEKEKKAEARVARAIEAATRKGIEAARKATADEHARQTDIKARCARYGVTTAEIEENGKKATVDLAAHAIAAGWDPDKAELYALRSARPGAEVGGPLFYVTNTPEVSEAVLECAVLQAHRRSFLLDDDGFYCEPTPDGKGSVRRVPASLQAETQKELRARYTDQVQQAAHTHFKSRIGLHELLAHSFRASGSNSRFNLRSEAGINGFIREWDWRERTAGIAAEGASTMSISNILANVLNKFALQGYLFVEQAWRSIAAVRPVNDFKPTKSINLLGDVMYKQLGPTGELENASFGDQAFPNQAAPYGRIATIPWVHLVNDDLSVLSTIPQKIGQGAGLALNDVFWTKFAAMVAGSAAGLADDGAAFFNAAGAGSAFHTTTPPAGQKAGLANKMSGGTSPLSATSLQTAKALFDNQIDPNGNPLGFDGIKPVILFGPSNWQTATALLQAAAIVYGGGSAALQPNANVWQGMLTPVMSRYVEAASYLNSKTGWGIFFNPVALAAIEVAFLNGVDTPAVLQAGPDYQFDRPGLSIRGTMPFGVTQQNFRAAVWSLGA